MKTFTASSLKPYKDVQDEHWAVTADLTGLETFENCESNYDVVERLKKNGVLTKEMEEDSEYSQFFAYFKTQELAEHFIYLLNKYVENRKYIKSLL